MREYFDYFLATEYSLLDHNKPTVTWIYKNVIDMANDFDIHKSSLYKVIKHKHGIFASRGKHSRLSHIKFSRTNSIDFENASRDKPHRWFKSEIVS